MQSKLTPQAIEVKQSQAAFVANPASLYLHIPFCVHHCHYCDFAVVSGKDHLADAYLDALEAEIRLVLVDHPSSSPIETLFIGGGTPTQLSPAQLERLLQMIRRHFTLSEGFEWSVEANPDGLTLDKIKVLAHNGVNRLSLGVQSFENHLLKLLERQHTREDVLKVLDRVRPYFQQTAIDLIFGIPEQSLEEWQSDLAWAHRLGLTHVSVYGLTYEKGTGLWKAMHQGKVAPLAESEEAALYRLAMTWLPEHGLEQYEIANFAVPGCACRHNQTYWANRPHYGFGLGAARYLQGCRSTNTRSLHTYLDRLAQGQSVVQHQEQLLPEERARETAMLNLRRAEGIVRRDFLSTTGLAIDDLASAAIHWGRANDWLWDDEMAIGLTLEGKLVADEVMSRFLVADQHQSSMSSAAAALPTRD